MSLEQLKKWFADSEDSSFDARARSERDRDYLDGKQLDADTAGAEEVILLRLVQQARDAVELPTTEPAGRGPLAHYLYP